MIDPILPPGFVQALAAKAERPLIIISELSLPKTLAFTAQPREIGGTVTQAAADGSAVLHTAAGDIGFKAPVTLTAGKTATLHLVPTAAGLAAAIQFNGPTSQLAPAPNVAPAASARPAASNGNAAMRGGSTAGTAQVVASVAHTPSQNVNPVPANSAPTAAGPLPATAAAAPAAPPAAPLAMAAYTPSAPAMEVPRMAAAASPRPPAPAPHVPQSSPALRDTALLLSQLAAQDADLLPIGEFAGRAPIDPLPPAAAPYMAPAEAASKPGQTVPNAGPVPANPAGLVVGLMAALKRPAIRRDDSAGDSGDRDIAAFKPLETAYRSSGRTGEPQDQLVWRQIPVMDENRIVPVFLALQQGDEETTDMSAPAAEAKPATRFTIRFDLEPAGPVRIDSVYCERRLDLLLRLEAAPDNEMGTMIRERLAALSEEFGLSISLRIGASKTTAG